MKINNVILRVYIRTIEDNDFECLLPFPIGSEISFTKLKELINNDVNAYYYNENNMKIDIAGKLRYILGIIISSKKKPSSGNNTNSYGNSFNLLDYIKSITSEDTAAQLAMRYGGMRVYIPKQPKENHPLAQLIGWTNLQTIIREIGNGYMLIPAQKYRGAGAKAKLICSLLKENKSVREIAQLADCCERTVWLHKSKYKARTRTEK